MEDRVTGSYAIGTLIQYAIKYKILTIPIPPQINSLTMLYDVPVYIAIDKFRMNSHGVMSSMRTEIDIVGAGDPYRILTVDGSHGLRENGPWDGPLDNALDILNKAVEEHKAIMAIEAEKALLVKQKRAETRRAEVAALFNGEMI